MDGGLSEESFAIEPGRVCFSLVLPSGAVWYGLPVELVPWRTEKRVLVYAKVPLYPSVQFYLLGHMSSQKISPSLLILLLKAVGNTVLSNSERTLSF